MPPPVKGGPIAPRPASAPDPAVPPLKKEEEISGIAPVLREAGSEPGVVKNPTVPPKAKSSRPPPPLSALTRYGRYDLLGRLAYGGMAEIFLAREAGAADTGRHLVIKRVLPHVADDQQFVQMFLDEARLAMQLNHPGICHIYEFGERDGSYFIAMEWVDGATLGKTVRRARAMGGVPIGVTARVIGQVAAALDYAHRARGRDGQALGIVHRDVTPQNIMVSYDGNVKLLDFGIAKAVTQIARTQAGTIKGKFAYMSPEQCQGLLVDSRSDIFALGICLHEVLTGEPLFHRKTEYESLWEIVNGELPSARSQNPEVPEELDAIVQKALAKAPSDRFQTAGEMQEALELWLMESRQVVRSAHVAALMEELYVEEIARGPLVDTTPFGSSFRKAGPRPADGATPVGAEELSEEVDLSALSRRRARRLPMPAVVSFVAAAILAAAGVALLPDGEDETPVLEAGPAPEPTPVPEPVPEPAPEPVPAVDPTPEPAPATAGSVAIQSTPPGATGRVGDHELPGQTPVTLGDLEPGIYEVTLTRAGFQPFSTRVTVVAGEEAEVLAVLVARPRQPVAPPGRLAINTRPWSRVYVGGRLLGTTPIASARVPSGTVRLRLVDREGRTHRRSVRVPAGGVERVFYDLNR